MHGTPFYALEPETPDDIQETQAWAGSGVPTAMFHGFGDFCIQPGDIQINHIISKGTGAPVKCIEVGIPMIGGIINDFEYVADQSCKKIAADKTFSGEFNVIGLSQGGLLARYIAEECDMPGKVRNIATFGGPHMGVDAVPGCFSGFICDIVNKVAKKLVYTNIVQHHLTAAGYFRDPKQYNTYVKDSVFLPALNNEHTSGAYTDLRKSKFTDVNAAMFVMFSED